MPNDSNTQRVVNYAVIKNDNGNSQLSEARSQLHTKVAVSRHVVETNRRTIGDILNDLEYDRQMWAVIYGINR